MVKNSINGEIDASETVNGSGIDPAGETLYPAVSDSVAVGGGFSFSGGISSGGNGEPSDSSDDGDEVVLLEDGESDTDSASDIGEEVVLLEDGESGTDSASDSGEEVVLLEDDMFGCGSEETPGSPGAASRKYFEPLQALSMSRGDFRGVDINFMCGLTGRTAADLIDELAGFIIRDPEGWSGKLEDGFVEYSEYLSGNLSEKLRKARAANVVYPDMFVENIRALTKAIESRPSAKHSYNLGMPSIPPQIIDRFIDYVLGGIRRGKRVWTHYDRESGLWRIHNKNSAKGNSRNCSKYGLPQLPFLNITERTLNSQSIEVTKSVRDAAGGRKYVRDNELTALALEKQRQIQKMFGDWVNSNPAVKEEIDKAYNEVFGCVAPRCFDGSHLTLPGLNPSVRLRPHQLDDVACILRTPNTLLCGEVGTGKTFTMIAAGHELHRTGMSKKVMYVVPNAIFAQWKADFKLLYPDSKLLAVSGACFKPAQRQSMLRRIRGGDYDAVLITDSSFGLIPMSDAFCIGKLEEERSRLLNTCGEKSRGMGSKLQKKIDKLDKEIIKLGSRAEKRRAAGESEGLCFDHLGIDTLFVDEAHNYKNITIKTNSSGVGGLKVKGTGHCDDMLDKVHYTQRTGRGVIFATATPISNSVTDIYVMQVFLQYGQLKVLDLDSFEHWLSTFTNREASLELDIDSAKYKTVNRILSFRNLPELAAYFGQVARYTADDVYEGRPKIINAELNSGPILKEYISSLSVRADNVHKGVVSRAEDNLLKITTDGRKAALDSRLVGLECDSESSKVQRCARNVYRVWKTTAEKRYTQLVFCDISTPKEGFNIYDELRSLLIGMGIPANEIAFIHDAKTETAKNRLFKSVNNGGVRVLIGSTQKLGTGVNVQRLVCAVHHLDVPWKPSDMVQREGRMLRQGNECDATCVFRYVTRGSFDAVSWQIVERKQLFIAQFMTNTLSADDFSFEEDALSYAEIKALAVGDPQLREKIQKRNELNRAKSLQRAFVRQRQQELDTIEALEPAIKKQRANITALVKDIRRTESEQCMQINAEERRSLAEELQFALENNVMRDKESLFCEVLGLSLYLPQDMPADKPSVILRGDRNYNVPLGASMYGNVARIENAIKKLPERLENACANLAEMKKRCAELREEAERPSPYIDRIIELSEELEGSGRINIEELLRELGIFSHRNRAGRHHRLNNILAYPGGNNNGGGPGGNNNGTGGGTP